MERAQERPADVARAAQRLTGPRARVSLGAKRAIDVALALAMLCSLLPVLVLVVVLLLVDGGGWLERRVRIGRDDRLLRLARFRPLPGRLGRALERIGACELPLLMAVVAGRLSFVGPRAIAPESGAGARGPRRLMAPGLTGPAQRWATDAQTAAALDDTYVEEWSLLGDLRLMAGVRCRRPMPVQR
jgi:lipopolysaccharide/colanic/teichoic acid biosynthesis glycosyltransferase